MRCITPRAIQRHAVEKLQRRDIHHMGRAAQVPLVHEMIEKRAHLRGAQAGRRPVMVRREPVHAPEIHVLRDGTHPVQPQVDRHPLA